MVPTYGELETGGQLRSLQVLGGNEMELMKLESPLTQTQQQLSLRLTQQLMVAKPRPHSLTLYTICAYYVPSATPSILNRLHTIHTLNQHYPSSRFPLHDYWKLIISHCTGCFHYVGYIHHGYSYYTVLYSV